MRIEREPERGPEFGAVARRLERRLARPPPAGRQAPEQQRLDCRAAAAEDMAELAKLAIPREDLHQHVELGNEVDRLVRQPFLGDL